MFNAPTIVIVLVAIMVAVHVGRSVAGDDLEYWLVVAMAFIPGRYGAEGGELPGAPWAALTSLVTHILVHGDYLHLFVNSAWLLAVGSPLARRLALPSFLVFAIVCGIGGAVMFLLLNPGRMVPMIGASGAISGLMAAVMRLMFAAPGMTGRLRLREDPPARRRCRSPACCGIAPR